MTTIDVRLTDGFAVSATSGVEDELSALSAEFAAGWAALLAVAPGATLTPLHVGDALSAAMLNDLQDAARMRGEDPPDLLRWFSLECPDDVAETVAALAGALPLVARSGMRPAAAPGALDDGTVSWGTNPLAVQSLQLRRAPLGVDALYSWRVDGGAGTGVNVADLEWGWWLDHFDLLNARIVRADVHGASHIAHGTAVAGVIAAADNGVGMVGIAPDTTLALITIGGRNAAAIGLAAREVGPGGVILIEAATSLSATPPPLPDVPLEVDPAVHDAIRLATALGVTVVEIAGNGGVDLDAPPPSDLDLGLPSRADSGAILVGAGEPTPQGWRPRPLSVRGERVDCFAQGVDVLAPDVIGPDAHRRFAGTSAAGAVIAAVVANIQGMALAATGHPLPPRQVRDLLRSHWHGTPVEPGFGGIGAMPDLRRIAKSQRWSRVLPVAAAAVADDAAVLVYLDDDDHLMRRHFSFFTGWGRPLPAVDTGNLFGAQPTVLSWNAAGRLVYLALASGVDSSGVDGVCRLWWDSDASASGVDVLGSEGQPIAAGSTVAAVLAAADEMVLVGVDRAGHLIALTSEPIDVGLGAPVVVDAVSQFRRTSGPTAVRIEDGTVDAVAIADHGVLQWFHGEHPFTAADDWSGVSEPTVTAFIAGARVAALSVEGRLLVAAVGDQGWLHVVEIDPSAGAAAAAFEPPVVVDTAVTLATKGPLALSRLTRPAADIVLVFGVDTERTLYVASRRAAGGDWTQLRAIESPVPLHPAGGAVAITLPDVGVMVFVVDVRGQIRFSQSRSGIDWTAAALLPDPPRPHDHWQPPSPIPNDPTALVSDLFAGDVLLQRIASDKDRISRTRNNSGASVGRIQQALLTWDPTALPNFGADQSYGDETAAAVRRFKRDLLEVPAAQVIDDVGPATVRRLDRIQADHEGHNGAATSLRFLTEYGDPLPHLTFTCSTTGATTVHTTDAAGAAATLRLSESASVDIDAASALIAVGDLLAREWPPAGGFPAADVLVTGAAPATVRVDSGDAVTVVVATRATLTAPRVAPLAGSVRVQGRGVAFSTTPEGDFVIALQAVGGAAATVWVDPVPGVGPAPVIPPLVGWTPLGTYTVRPGDTEENLAAAFLGDPTAYAELSNHPPVPGEQLVLPELPEWLAMATAPIRPTAPALWFTVSPDAVVAAVLAGDDTAPLQDLLAVLDRPPSPDPDPAAVIGSRAATLLATLTQTGPPLGPDFTPEDTA